MDTGERLAAYVAGDLDADERAAVEAQLARDAALRRRLERIRSVDAMLADLQDVAPPDGLRERLDERLAAELHGHADELATRRSARRSAWRPFAIAAAAAAVVAVVGVSAGTILRGGAGGGADVATAPEAGSAGSGTAIGPYETDNDYSSQELQRLAVNVDVSGVLPSGLTPEGAQALADRYQGELFGLEEVAELTSRAQDAAGDAAITSEPQLAPDEVGPVEERLADTPAYQRCAPEVLASSPDPLIPVYVELARFDGEPAIIYAFATVDPDSGTYRRIEVWAVAEADCHVFNYTAYDRE